MALTVMVRGGDEVVADTDTDFLTATTDTSVFVTIANGDTVAATVQLFNRHLGAALNDDHRIVRDYVLQPGDVLPVPHPINMLATDVLGGRSTSASVTFRWNGWREG